MGLGVAAEPVSGIASVVVGVTTAILKANAARSLSRRASRTQTYINQLEQEHVAELGESWSRVTIALVPVAVAGAVFAAFVMTQGSK